MTPLPPLLAADTAVHVMTDCPLAFDVPAAPVGATGTVAGTAEPELEKLPSPTEFFVETRK